MTTTMEKSYENATYESNNDEVATQRYLTFNLATERYGIDILKVREIVGLLPITPMPRAAVHVRGVVNLRGRIIPVVDARTKLAMAGVEATRETCIITVTLKTNTAEVLVGLLVDSVADVAQIEEKKH